MHLGFPEVAVRDGRMALGFLLLTLALALPVVASEHPVKLDKDADCASCHEDKTKGKAVHSAIAMGCTTCHEVKTEGETTNVNLTAPKEQICFNCHEKSNDPTLHAPYEKGLCVDCHDPHTSDHLKQLRQEVNPLCLQCHAARRVEGDTVQLAGNQSILTADFRAIPKIVADPSQTKGHPFVKHPLAGVNDPLRGGEPMSCLSCHAPHSSTQDKLIRTTKEGVDFCDACHQAAEGKKQPATAVSPGTPQPNQKKTESKP